MLRSTRQSALAARRMTGTAPLRRPGAVGAVGGRGGAGGHPLCREDENARLLAYERMVKEAFDGIVPILKEISALQHETDFVAQARRRGVAITAAEAFIVGRDEAPHAVRLSLGTPPDRRDGYTQKSRRVGRTAQSSPLQVSQGLLRRRRWRRRS